jgi:ribosomal protein S14
MQRFLTQVLVRGLITRQRYTLCAPSKGASPKKSKQCSSKRGVFRRRHALTRRAVRLMAPKGLSCDPHTLGSFPDVHWGQSARKPFASVHRALLRSSLPRSSAAARGQFVGVMGARPYLEGLRTLQSD